MAGVLLGVPSERENLPHKCSLSSFSAAIHRAASPGLSQLQQIDTLSKQLTKEQFDSWVSKYTNYTLRYVDIFSANSTSITGACYYTRELVNGMTMNGNTDLAMMTFTMNHTDRGWKLAELGELANPIFNDKANALADLNQKAMAKYKTDNLATLWQ